MPELHFRLASDVALSQKPFEARRVQQFGCQLRCVCASASLNTDGEPLSPPCPRALRAPYRFGKSVHVGTTFPLALRTATGLIAE